MGVPHDTPSEEVVEFGAVDPDEAHDAYEWHREFAKSDSHILPRTWEDYEELADQWRIVCAKTSNGHFVGLAYFAFDDETNEWEIGGLMVADGYQGAGIGSSLMRIALGRLLVEENPLSEGQNVIAHVHAENQAPRGVIEGLLKFRHTNTVTIPGHKLPGLKTDDEGNIHGDVFEITVPDSLLALAEWCEQWSNQLLDGRPARIELREFTTLSLWADVLRGMAEEVAAT